MSEGGIWSRGVQTHSCLQGKASGLPACSNPLCQGWRLSPERVASLKALVPGLRPPPQARQPLAAGSHSGSQGREQEQARAGAALLPRMHLQMPPCAVPGWEQRLCPGPLHQLHPLLGVLVLRSPGAQTVPVLLWPGTPCWAVPAEAEDLLVAALGASWALTPGLHGVKAQKKGSGFWF